MFIQKIAFVSLLGAATVGVHMTYSLAAHAEEVRSLEKVMSEMGKKFGPLARPVQQGNAGPAEAVIANQLHALVLEADSILPPVILRLPQGDHRNQREALYHELMQKLADAVAELEAAISSGDIARSKAALQVILGLRGQGHSEFKI